MFLSSCVQERAQGGSSAEGVSAEGTQWMELSGAQLSLAEFGKLLEGLGLKGLESYYPK